MHPGQRDNKMPEDGCTCLMYGLLRTDNDGHTTGATDAT